jgi:hypothetical protein
VVPQKRAKPAKGCILGAPDKVQQYTELNKFNLREDRQLICKGLHHDSDGSAPPSERSFDNTSVNQSFQGSSGCKGRKELASAEQSKRRETTHSEMRNSQEMLRESRSEGGRVGLAFPEEVVFGI